MYLQDIEQFLDLGCNRRGPNVIVLSAHGNVVKKRSRKRLRFRRQLTAFDGEININKGIVQLKDKLARSIVVLDSCSIGVSLDKFRERSRALAAIGFADEVDWVDSSMFVLALLFKLHQESVLSMKRARSSTENTTSRTETVIAVMIKGPYASMAKSLGVQTAF